MTTIIICCLCTGETQTSPFKTTVTIYVSSAIASLILLAIITRWIYVEFRRYQDTKVQTKEIFGEFIPKWVECHFLNVK